LSVKPGEKVVDPHLECHVPPPSSSCRCSARPRAHWRHGDVERSAGGSGWDDGGGAAGLQQMALYPRTVRKHAVPPLRSRTRPRALIPTASSQPDSGYGTAVKRVSFTKTGALWQS